MTRTTKLTTLLLAAVLSGCTAQAICNKLQECDDKREPDDPGVCAANYNRKFRKGLFAISPDFMADLERRPWWHRASLEGIPALKDPTLLAFRQKQSRVPPQSDEQLRHMIANYYGMIALADRNVGRVLQALDDLALAADTLVVFTSDHGDWLGDHGLILKGPMHYEGLLRVGCILRGPGVPAGCEGRGIGKSEKRGVESGAGPAEPIPRREEELARSAKCA